MTTPLIFNNCIPIENIELSLAFEPPCRIRGQFPPGSDPHAVVCVSCDGQHWARVPVSSSSDGARFEVDLPTVAESRPIDVVIRSESGATLGSIAVTGSPRLNAHGLSASRVRAVYDLPLFSAPWMSFDGARIVISGSHLPPAGDPGQLSVRFGRGVAFDLDYPLPSPEFESHFWYWPNAGLSGFRLTIDLASSSAGSDPFSFEFAYADEPVRSRDARHMPRIGRKVHVPPRLDSGICFPRDADQLTRVQTWSNDQSVTMTGYSAFKTIETLFDRYGVRDAPGVDVLDWGCGHGRVTRHLIRDWSSATIVGADVDRQNVEWSNANLDGEFLVFPLLPPTTVAAESFDGIFGISVMTHLAAEVQVAWLIEIARILKPGGVALISFAGFGAAAFSSVFRAPEWWDRWLETGFDDEQHDPALDGRIDDGAYYRNTLQSPSQLLGAWSDIVEVVDIYPSAIGYQDVAVLRRRDHAKRRAG